MFVLVNPLINGSQTMKIRRVVTGHTSEGKAIVASDEMVDGVETELVPGMELHRLWGSDGTLTFPDSGSKPAFQDYFPPVGGFRFGLFTVPPMSAVQAEDSSPAKNLAEFEEKLPGMITHMEPDNPGMHTSNTVDFEYIISGEVWLELDDGKEVHLKAGDTVIQNGTRHAWRNRSSEPCRMVVIMIGANRKET